MASFQKYETKQGKLWLFKMDTGINPQTGKRQTTTRRGFNTKKEAQAAAVLLEHEIASGHMINNNNLTYQDVFEQWFSDHVKTIKTSTRKCIESKFHNHILPRLGKLKIKDITKPYCQKMINEIADSIASVNDIKIQANQVFKYAQKMDIIIKNPMEYIIIPRQQKELVYDDSEGSKRNYWRKDEVKHFLSLTKQDLPLRDYVLFHLLIFTGARKGELLGLTWDNVDYESGSIRVNKTLYQGNGKYELNTTKTTDSKRLISIDTQTITLLKKLRIQQKEAILACGFSFRDHCFVFTRDDGKPLRLAYPNDKLKTLIKKHNLHSITIHGLRHTHASLLIEAGVGIKEVQDRLGHSDIQTTLNTYAHVTDTLKEQTASKFQKYIEL